MLSRATAVLADGDVRVDLALVRLGLVPDQELASAYAQALNLPLWPVESLPEVLLDRDQLNPHFLRHAVVVPVSEQKDSLIVAFCDPLDDTARRAMEFVARRPVQQVVASRSWIEAVLGRDARSEREVGTGDVLIEDAERLRDLASGGPIIRRFNSLLDVAVENGATDLHVEPMIDRVRIRVRVDGILRELDCLPARDATGLISRIKIMSGLDIGERRLGQDGRIRQTIRGRDLDLRVSIVPTAHGEGAVLRLLEMSQATVHLSDLGFRTHVSHSVTAALDRPHGILLVTGPTGSGKTTTLYAGLAALNKVDRKILTVEDPIEYMLDGVCQTQVKPAIGLDFAAVLRSFLRQDPDVIMIGEIRDGETAEIAVQAALTGHLVISTLHTNDAAGAVPRLIDMGIDPFLLTASLSGVLAQRLVRTLCEACKRPTYAGVYEAVGCPVCSGTGYRGRTAIGEYLPVTDPIRTLIRDRATAAELARAAIVDGMVPMTDDGMALVACGRTTREEVFRVSMVA